VTDPAPQPDEPIGELVGFPTLGEFIAMQAEGRRVIDQIKADVEQIAKWINDRRDPPPDEPHIVPAR
jgi:hypothetical protein